MAWKPLLIGLYCVMQYYTGNNVTDLAVVRESQGELVVTAKLDGEVHKIPLGVVLGCPLWVRPPPEFHPPPTTATLEKPAVICAPAPPTVSSGAAAANIFGALGATVAALLL